VYYPDGLQEIKDVKDLDIDRWEAKWIDPVTGLKCHTTGIPVAVMEQASLDPEPEEDEDDEEDEAKS